MNKKADRPTTLVSSNAILFESFFDAGLVSRLTQLTDWQRNPARTVTPALRKALRNAELLITTWDSPPYFPEELLNWAPSLRLITHCGGSVKTHFARPLFDRLVITNAARSDGPPRGRVGSDFSALPCSRCGSISRTSAPSFE